MLHFRGVVCFMRWVWELDMGIFGEYCKGFLGLDEHVTSIHQIRVSG